MNPKTVENNRHTGEPGRGAELIAGGVSSTIHRNTGERPSLRSGGRTIDSIPRVDVKSVSGFFRRRRPCFCSLGIVAACRVERVNTWQPRGTMEYIISELGRVIGGGGNYVFHCPSGLPSIY